MRVGNMATQAGCKPALPGTAHLDDRVYRSFGGSASMLLALAGILPASLNAPEQRVVKLLSAE